MLAVPSRESRQLLAPASLLQKALRRGRALSDSQAPAMEAIRALLHSESCTVSDLGYQVRSLLKDHPLSVPLSSS